jgi:hypothetical protein
MTSRAYIVDFSEPGQVADAYEHYFRNFAFLLNTSDEIKLFTQIKIRFNFPDGHGTTVVARVVSILPDNGYGLQLADTSVTHWVLEKAKEYAERVGRNRGGGKEKQAAAKVPPEPTVADLTTRRIDPPPKGLAATPGARTVVGEEEEPSLTTPGPSTKPVSQKKVPVGTPPAQPEIAVDGDPTGDELDPEPAPSGPDEEELRRRVAELDRLVAEAGAKPGETLQAAPPVAAAVPVNLADTKGAEQEDGKEPTPPAEPTPQPKLEELVAALSDKQKKKLAISGGEEERRLLMVGPDHSLHIWVLKNPGLTEAEVVDFAANPSLSPDALNFLLQNRRWGTAAAVADILVVNPNTPPEAIPNLLTVLPQAKLKQLAETPGVRHLVARQARRVLMERSQI